MKFSKNNISALAALAFVVLLGLACGSSTPPPPAYVGAWTGADGTTITIRADGGADYKSGNSNVTGGSVTIDDAAKTLKVSLAGLGPTFKIDKAPEGNQMTLDGVLYKKAGGDSSPAKSTSIEPASSDAKPPIPSEDALQTLAKTTISDFSDGVQKGDFTDFHAKVAKIWQEQDSVEDMNDAFKEFVDKKESYDFKKAIGSTKATFTPAPFFESVAGRDALALRGNYATKPMKTLFEFKYVMEGDAWKLVYLNVRTSAE